MITRDDILTEIDFVLRSGGYIRLRETNDPRVTLVCRYYANTLHRGSHDAEISMDEVKQHLASVHAVYTSHLGYQLLPSHLPVTA